MIATVVALAIAAGTWALVSASDSTSKREGATYNVISKKVNYGSKIVIRNDGPYLLRVTDMQNGAGVVYLQSCTMETYWPKVEEEFWWVGPTVNEYLFPPTPASRNFLFDTYAADPTACQHEWIGKVKGQFTDLDLQIEACVPLRGHLSFAGTASEADKTSAANTYGCHLQNKHYDYDGSTQSHAWGLQVDRVKARSSAAGVHAISKGLQSITDNYTGRSEVWEFSAGYGQGLQFTVVASEHKRMDEDNPYVYTLQNFGPPKCLDAAYSSAHLDCSE
ncbi:MAG: hypothetical protein F2789_00245 [Actinobacteria bacterium]|nr:hypothetical protein [Actinomycetota bacterium]